MSRRKYKQVLAVASRPEPAPMSQGADTQRVPEMADAPISSSEYEVIAPGGARVRPARTGRWNTEELAEYIRRSVAPPAE